MASEEASLFGLPNQRKLEGLEGEEDNKEDTEEVVVSEDVPDNKASSSIEGVQNDETANPKTKPSKENSSRRRKKPDKPNELNEKSEKSEPLAFVASLKKSPEKKFFNKSFNVSNYCFETIDEIYKNSNYTRNDFLVEILNMYLVANISPEFDSKVKGYVKEILDRKTDGDTSRKLVNIKASVSLHNTLDMRLAHLKIKIPTLSKGYFLEAIVVDFIRNYINHESEDL